MTKRLKMPLLVLYIIIQMPSKKYYKFIENNVNDSVQESEEKYLTENEINEINYNHMRYFFLKMTDPIEYIYKKYKNEYYYFCFLKNDKDGDNFHDFLNIIYNNIKIDYNANYEINE